MALLDDATNTFGRLDKDTKARIMRFMDDPSSETWDDILSIIINEQASHQEPRTIWQAVVAVDPTFPRVGPSGRQPWARIPDPMLVARAIKAATKR